MKKISFLLAIALMAGVVIIGCAQQTSTDSNIITPRAGTYSYSGTQSPGDVWSWTITSSHILGTNETSAGNYYYGGNYTAYASGFNKAVITETNDTSVPTDGTFTAYFLEYPNTVLLVYPGGNNIIVCAARAATAPPAGQYNYINIPWPGWTRAKHSYGTVEVTESGGSYTFDVCKYDLDGNLVEVTQEAGYGFSDGRLIRVGRELQVFLTPSGAFLGDNGKDYGGFAGVINQSVDFSALAAKEFRGVLFSYDVTSHHDLIEAIGAEPHPTLAHALSGFSFSDVEKNIRETGGVTLEFGAQAGNGIISGTLTHRNGTVDYFDLVAASVGGKYIVFGIATDGSGRPQNFLVVEK
jgi:hypothetical protein